MTNSTDDKCTECGHSSENDHGVFPDEVPPNNFVPQTQSYTCRVCVESGGPCATDPPTTFGVVH